MRYAELHAKTNFSFLEGASHGNELVARAGELGYTALAITDRNSLAGVVRAHAAARLLNADFRARNLPELKLIIGAEITPADAPPVVLWAPDREAYGRLARLITIGRRRADKGECKLTFADVVQHSQGLLAGVVLTNERRLDRSNKAAYTGLGRYHDVFADRCYLLAELHRGPDDARRLGDLLRLSRRTQVPLAAAGDVHYHVPSRLPLQHVLTALRHKVCVFEAGDKLFPNAQRHLHVIQDIEQKFAAAPDAIERTVEIADRCRFSLSELSYEYPPEVAPAGMTPMEYLRVKTWEGARKRYPQGIPEAVSKKIVHEFELIEDLRYEAFFLTVWDVVKFARDRGILCQGRGSSANSVVCYCLEITSVDPNKIDLLFERFVSRQRNEPPDIDVDFEHERREEVLQYLWLKYGRQRVGMAATIITYRSRSAVRDVGRALGLSNDFVDRLAKNIDGYSRGGPEMVERCLEMGLDPNSEVGSRFLHLVEELIGFPRHLSQHVGGMVVSAGPLCELVPIENAAMVDRTVVQWDKDDLEELGLIKVDCLCLGMLTAIRKCFDMIEAFQGKRPGLAELAEVEEEAVYDMICAADVKGCFQIESRAQMNMLPRLKPRTFYDLVVEIAIVRPGPIQGGFVHPYLKRRSGAEPVTYPSDAVRKVLEKTKGVPIFQEQVMQLAIVAAGFTPEEADQLRRAMGTWKKSGMEGMENYRKKLVTGMLERGLTEEFADQVFQQIKGFGEYGFPESHAASFGLLVYASAWLKHHYPAAFCAALVNSQPMGFYSPGQLIRDVRRRVEVREIDVNFSEWDCTLEADGALRLGMRLIKGLAPVAAEMIVVERTRHGAYASIDDVVRRTRIGRGALVRLASADAFNSLKDGRRPALWKILAHEPRPKQQPLLAYEPSGEAPELPILPLSHEVVADYAATSLSLRPHPISFHRQELNALGVKTAAQLAECPHGKTVLTAGLVLLRQRPGTSKGVVFCTLEDETNESNLVFYQAVWERYRRIVRGSSSWLVKGTVQQEGGVVHLVASQVWDLSDRLHGLHAPARDDMYEVDSGEGSVLRPKGASKTRGSCVRDAEPEKGPLLRRYNIKSRDFH